MIDEASREALYIEVGISIPSARLIRALNRLIDWYASPDSIRMDNGPEMMSHDFIDWAAAKGIQLNQIETGELSQNAYIERFNRAYRHEVLDAYLFKSIEQVELITEDWLRIYNEQRPHDALARLPPKQFLPRLTTTADYSHLLPTRQGSLRTGDPAALKDYRCRSPTCLGEISGPVCRTHARQSHAVAGSALGLSLFLWGWISSVTFPSASMSTARRPPSTKLPNNSSSASARRIVS